MYTKNQIDRRFKSLDDDISNLDAKIENKFKSHLKMIQGLEDRNKAFAGTIAEEIVEKIGLHFAKKEEVQLAKDDVWKINVIWGLAGAGVLALSGSLFLIFSTFVA